MVFFVGGVLASISFYPVLIKIHRMLFFGKIVDHFASRLCVFQTPSLPPVRGFLF
jgi:hypothetical protein